MKIGFVLDDTLDSTDGVQQYILTVGDWLRSQGNDVHYLVGQTTRSDIPSVHSLSRNMKVRFNGNRMSMPLPFSAKNIRQILETEKFDILHIQMPYSPFLTGSILRAAPAETAVVGTFHIAPNSTIVRIANKALGLYVKKSLKRFDEIVAVSREAAIFADRAYGISASVIPNAVDINFFAAAEPMESRDERPLIVFVGRFVPRKGAHILLEAVKLLCQDSNPVKLRVVLCGRGPMENDLRRFVTENNLEDSVEFAGFVSDADKARYLRAADMAVFPSSGGESFGIVLIEAMAAGKPVVIGAENPGYATVLGVGPDVLVPVNDPLALAQKIRYVLQDDVSRKTILDWQGSYVGQFDIQVVGSQIIKMYDRALHKRRTV